jgi:hypothetical protein
MTREDRLFSAILGFLVWLLVSAGASAIKLDNGSCGKKYPVDYVLYTNLFCEIKDSQ